MSALGLDAHEPGSLPYHDKPHYCFSRAENWVELYGAKRRRESLKVPRNVFSVHLNIALISKVQRGLQYVCPRHCQSNTLQSACAQKLTRFKFHSIIRYNR